MSEYDRAAQFAPFAALVGYEEAISESARETTKRISLSDDMKSLIDMKLGMLAETPHEKPFINVTYFKPDKIKDGGEYITVSGNFEKIDEYNRSIVFSDKRQVAIRDIYDITGDLPDLF